MELLNHIHFLIGMKPSCCLSDLVREVKKSSNEFINEGNYCKFRFNLAGSLPAGRQGFGAFSYSDSQLNDVVSYIRNQKEHHRKKTFKEEYVALLKRYQVDFDERYLFDWNE